MNRAWKHYPTHLIWIDLCVWNWFARLRFRCLPANVNEMWTVWRPAQANKSFNHRVDVFILGGCGPCGLKEILVLKQSSFSYRRIREFSTLIEYWISVF